MLLLGSAPSTLPIGLLFENRSHINSDQGQRGISPCFPPKSCPCGVGSYWIIAATEEVEMLQTQACASWWRAWTVWEHSWPWCGSVELVWRFQFHLGFLQKRGIPKFTASLVGQMRFQTIGPSLGMNISARASPYPYLAELHTDSDWKHEGYANSTKQIQR